MSIVDVLKRLVDDRLAEEGITAGLLEMVDLSVAYSPVIAIPGEGLDQAVEVRPWGFVPDDPLPQRFEVLHPLVRNPVGQDTLKVMRARYLLARDAYYGPIIHHYFHVPVEEESVDRTDDCGLPHM